MKRAGEIFSGFCIVTIICIHLVMFLKPFEWQRKAAEKTDYVAFFEQLENEKKAGSNDFDFEVNFDSLLNVSGQ